MLPLTVGLVLSVLLHLLGAASYGWWSGDPADESDEPAGPQPDLVAVEIAFDQPPVARQPAPVVVTITNTGAIGATGFEYELKVDDQTVKRDSIADGLALGASLDLQAEIEVAEPGLRRVRLVVDPRDRVRELDEVNNVLERDVVWLLPDRPGPRMADLTIYKVNAPKRTKVDQPTPVELFVANLGDAPVDLVDIGLTLDGEPLQLFTVESDERPTLEPGEVMATHTVITVDRSGLHELGAEVDPGHKVVEADETNNRIFTKLLVEKPGVNVGMSNPSVLSMNTISYEDFQELVATRPLWFDQPTVQMTAEPDPDAQREPVDPTPPALVSQEQMGASPSQPRPEREVSKTPPPTAGVAEQQPEFAALAPNEDETRAAVGRQPVAVDESFNVEVIDPTPALKPDDASPIESTDSPAVVITDPTRQLPTGDEPDTAAPRPDTLLNDEVIRESPDAERADGPDLADATRPIDGPVGDEPAEPTSEMADPLDESTDPTEPAEAEDSEVGRLTEPVEVAMAEVTEPQDATVVQPDRRPSVASDANPTVAPRADAEAPAATRFEQSYIIPGRVWAQQGVRLKTVRPRFSPAARMTAYPFNPIVRIEFDGEGKVIRVNYVRSSGWDNVDAPLRVAIYKWTAEGDFDPNGFVIEKMLIVLNPTAKQAEEYEAKQEPAKPAEDSDSAKPASDQDAPADEGGGG